MQRTARFLTFAGAFPFVFATYVMASDDQFSTSPFLLAYSAVILSFLGGIQWGVAMRQVGDARLSAWGMAIATGPSLVGWAALAVGGKPGLGVAAAGFVAACAIDYAFGRMELLPAWYLPLRLQATGLVLACLAVAACL